MVENTVKEKSLRDVLRAAGHQLRALLQPPEA